MYPSGTNFHLKTVVENVMQVSGQSERLEPFPPFWNQKGGQNWL
jgi:hypothetical protein